MLKSVIIANTFLAMFYIARFKTFRNSYLGPMMLVATAAGIKNGVDGTGAIFDSYLFNKYEIRLSQLEDVDLPTGKLTTSEKRVLNDVLSLAYTSDYLKL